MKKIMTSIGQKFNKRLNRIIKKTKKSKTVFVFQMILKVEICSYQVTCYVVGFQSTKGRI